MQNVSEFIVGSGLHLKETHVAFTCTYIIKTEVKLRNKIYKKNSNSSSLNFSKNSSAMDSSNKRIWHI